MLKLFEIILGSCCETLLIRFGMPAANDIGEAFFTFHSTVSTCLSTTLILMISYFLSAKTYNLMQQSLFEVLFNAFACFLYASSSSYMGFASNLSLYPRFISSSSDAAFPALVSVYVSVNEILKRVGCVCVCEMLMTHVFNIVSMF